MIVKDESHIIVDTLKNLARFIRFDTYAISDTGSTDDTKALIKAFFDEQGISGEIHDDPWLHFGHNRSVAFQHAYQKADYSFVWDADDRIIGDFKLPASLTADSYTFTFGAPGSTRYSRAQLFNSHKVWKYVGVLHEYPRCEESAGQAVGSPVGVVGPYWFESNRTGARNKDPEKYAKDAAILDRAFHEAVAAQDPLHHRYAFYCAQSYRSANNLPKAIEFYKQVLALEGNWAQERYNACLELYMMCDEQKRPEEGLHWLVESHKYDKTRVEGIYRLVQYYCVRNQPDVAFAYYTLIQEHYEKEFRADLLQQYLFAKTTEYTFYLPYYMIIVAERTKRR
jgi:glycosyltransferase involved in cell wall biosynthesis